MSHGSLKFEIPPEVVGDRVFDAILAEVERLFEGAPRERERALNAALIAAGVEPALAWAAMPAAVVAALAMLYVQRNRPATPHA